MKIVEESVDVYTRVKSGTRSEKRYIADDGSAWDNELSCLARDAEIKAKNAFNSIKTKSTETLPLTPDNWYFASTEDELDSIKSRLGYFTQWGIVTVNDLVIRRNGREVTVAERDLKVGDWVGFSMEYGDQDNNDPDYHHFYTWDYFKKSVLDIIESF